METNEDPCRSFEARAEAAFRRKRKRLRGPRGCGTLRTDGLSTARDSNRVATSGGSLGVVSSCWLGESAVEGCLLASSGRARRTGWKLRLGSIRTGTGARREHRGGHRRLRSFDVGRLRGRQRPTGSSATSRSAASGLRQERDRSRLASAGQGAARFQAEAAAADVGHRLQNIHRGAGSRGSCCSAISRPTSDVAPNLRVADILS